MPRGIQDHILSCLSMSSNSVSYVNKKGVQVYDHENIELDISTLAFNDTMAHGLCEILYQYSTFRLYDCQLLGFVGSK